MKRNHPLLAELSSPAEIVWPALESCDIEEAVQQAVDLTKVASEGSNLRQAMEITGNIKAGLESLHVSLAELNASGGLTASQLSLAEANASTLCQQADIPAPTFGIAMEGYSEPESKCPANLEKVEELIIAMESNEQDLAADMVDSVDDHCEVLKSALPNAAARMNELVMTASGGTNTDARMISGEGFADVLMCGDEWSENFPQYMDRYVALGMKLCGAFIPAAIQCANTACGIKNISMASSDEFHASTASAFDASLDPRSCLTDEDFETPLPGDGPLFATADDYEEGEDSHFSEMDKFAKCNGPCDVTDYTADGEAPVEVPALSPADVVRVATALRDLIMDCDVAQFQEDSQQCSTDMNAGFKAVSEAYDNADDSVVGDGTRVEQLSGYLDAAQNMTQWTPVYFLANLLQTANAFEVYAQRSLDASE